MPRIFLKKKITTPLAEGFPWIFDGDIGEVEGGISTGDIVPVFTHNGSFIGKGFYSQASKIKVRLLSRNRNREIDPAWWREKLKKCRQFRERLGLTENCRLVYGESDGLPGLIVDNLGGYLIVQSMTAGMDANLDTLGPLLQDIFSPKGIFLRLDAAARSAEGLARTSGFSGPAFDTIVPLRLPGMDACADLAQGPPIHFYLDTRMAVSGLLPLFKGADVFVPFSRTGIPEAMAVRNDAASVEAIMTEAHYLACATKFCQTIDPEQKINFSAGNAFDVLKQNAQADKKYDLIFLDPPGFAKGKASLPQARNAWRELNLRAMQLLKPGGFLATTVRTHLMPTEEFIRLLQECARGGGRRLRVLQTGGLPPDFPRLPYLPQGDYLKFVFAEIG